MTNHGLTTLEIEIGRIWGLFCTRRDVEEGKYIPDPNALIDAMEEQRKEQNRRKTR